MSTPSFTCPGLVIAAPSSGSGKTLLTLGLLRALSNNGVSVGSAKVGPDYIDPAFHSAATGRPCVNLDPWAMRGAFRRHLVAGLSRGAQLIVCEGVMGLFDGATATEGSTADLAAETGWPVVLVVDARAQAASAAAIVKGFAGMRDDVRVGGVIFNRVGSERHRNLIREAMAHYQPHVQIIGFLPRNDALSLPSRHLGLVQAGEHQELDGFLNAAADFICQHVDLGMVRETAETGMLDGTEDTMPSRLPPLGQRIAVAQDQAFAFSYAHILDGWRQAGAELVMFSPLNDDAPSTDADAIYLPGGYPELHAGALANGQGFLPGLRDAAARGVGIFGECGGYMVLGDGMVDADGARHAMAGLLPLETSFAARKLHLGYRQVTLVDPDGKNGGLADGTCRAHEFHYATVISENGADPLFRASDAQGIALGHVGLVRQNVAGSFIHLVDRHE